MALTRRASEVKEYINPRAVERVTVFGDVTHIYLIGNPDNPVRVQENVDFVVELIAELTANGCS